MCCLLAMAMDSSIHMILREQAFICAATAMLARREVSIGKASSLVSACDSTEQASSAGVVIPLSAGCPNSRGPIISYPAPIAALGPTQRSVPSVRRAAALHTMKDVSHLRKLPKVRKTRNLT